MAVALNPAEIGSTQWTKIKDKDCYTDNHGHYLHHDPSQQGSGNEWQEYTDGIQDPKPLAGFSINSVTVITPAGAGSKPPPGETQVTPLTTTLPGGAKLAAKDFQSEADFKTYEAAQKAAKDLESARALGTSTSPGVVAAEKALREAQVPLAAMNVNYRDGTPAKTAINAELQRGGGLLATGAPAPTATGPLELNKPSVSGTNSYLWNGSQVVATSLAVPPKPPTIIPMPGATTPPTVAELDAIMAPGNNIQLLGTGTKLTGGYLSKGDDGKISYVPLRTDTNVGKLPDGVIPPGAGNGENPVFHSQDYVIRPGGTGYGDKDGKRWYIEMMKDGKAANIYELTNVNGHWETLQYHRSDNLKPDWNIGWAIAGWAS